MSTHIFIYIQLPGLARMVILNGEPGMWTPDHRTNTT